MGWNGSTDPRFRKGKGDQHDIEQLEKLLTNYKIGKEPKLEKHFHLKIDKSRTNHRDFIKKSSEFRFPNIEMMSFTNMTSFKPSEFDIFNHFFTHAMPYRLEKFAIVSKNPPSYPKIDDLFDALMKALSWVHDEVFINGFELHNTHLSRVIEACHNVKKLVIMNCKIKIDPTFKLDKELEYKTKHISLFNSYYQNNKWYMNYQMFETLVDQMKDTGLKDTLKRIHITQYKHNGKVSEPNDERNLLKKKEMDVEIIADNNWPHAGKKKKKEDVEDKQW